MLARLFRQPERPKYAGVDIDLLEDAGRTARGSLVTGAGVTWGLVVLSSLLLPFLAVQRIDAARDQQRAQAVMAGATAAGPATGQSSPGVTEIQGELRAARIRLQAAEEGVRELRASQFPLATLIQAIGDLAPDGVRLTAVRQGDRPRDLTLEGVTAHEASALVYAERLARNPLLTEAALRTLGATAALPAAAGGALTFTITVAVRPAGGPAG